MDRDKVRAEEKMTKSDSDRIATQRRKQEKKRKLNVVYAGANRRKGVTQAEAKRKRGSPRWEEKEEDNRK